jgi:glutamate/tyrosine decarboxylase-like PLP-dependent enzyme
MGKNFPRHDELNGIIKLLSKEASAYFKKLDSLPVRDKNADKTAKSFFKPLPGNGAGSLKTLRLLIDKSYSAAVHSAGPRFFHFVVGGSNPAAFGADWVTSMLDQIAYAWVTSPLAVRLEILSLTWLKELFELPANWSGIMVTGATMANYTCLVAAREWWGKKYGKSISEHGFTGLPQVPVLSGEHIHASSVKSLSMLGIGRASDKKFIADNSGRIDLNMIEDHLQKLNGTPAIIIGTAGEPNTGAFDPIEQLADLAEKYGAWLHVDGAFGLFAKVSSSAKYLVKGIERADSVSVDGHKWLNVPYDCGFSFVKDGQLLGSAFAYNAAYLPDPEDPHPNMGSIGPESSRRARSLAVWATLNAYGRKGISEMIDKHIALAQKMSRLVDDSPVLERLAEVTLNIVCFRYNPGNFNEDELNAINKELGEALLSDGRYYAGTTTYKGKIALRPAIVNWRTTEKNIDEFIKVIKELGNKAEKKFSKHFR